MDETVNLIIMHYYIVTDLREQSHILLYVDRKHGCAQTFFYGGA